MGLVAWIKTDDDDDSTMLPEMKANDMSWYVQ